MERNMIVIGHRGSAGYEPENTLRSFQKAIDLGVGGIELDVRKSSDGVLVVIHDDEVDRTSNGVGYVSSLSFNQLRKLSFGKGEGIPTLEEVFTAFGEKCLINVELKEKGIGDNVLSLIRKFNLFGNVVASSFSEMWDELLILQNNNSKFLISFIVKTKAVAKKALVLAQSYRIFSINISIKLFLKHPIFTITFLKKIHNSTKSAVFFYTINFRFLATILSILGADGFFSDFPDRLKTLK